jgi:hypothetical protein
MANLASDPKMTLHNACYDAYNRQAKLAASSHHVLPMLSHFPVRDSLQ